MAKSDDSDVRKVPMDRISVSPCQPRRRINPEQLEWLADSIREHGILQPLIVRPLTRGYQLLAGERRLRAARLAGLGEVPVIVRDVDGETAALIALVENLQREDLSYWDEAEGYFRLQQEFRLSQTEIARRMGLSQGTVANKMRLLNLEGEVRALIEEAGLSEHHARIVLRVHHVGDRKLFCQRMIQESWTVRQAEEWVRAYLNHGSRQEKPSSPAKSHRTVVKDFRIVYNAFKQTVRAVEKSGMDIEMSHVEDASFWEIRVRIPKNQEG